ncbi:MAG: hypothetical protein ABIT37_22125 [Luteolibacter sp.]
MISRATVRIAATHGLFLAIGLCSTQLLAKREISRKSVGQPEISRISSSRITRGGHRGLTSGESFLAAHRELASRSMSRDERWRLRDLLFKEWGDRDPQGLLAFLDRTQVWPGGVNLYLLGDLERERPDLLLDFAIRNGCQMALSSLEYGDPSEVARLIDALPSSQKGVALIKLRDHAYQKMGKREIVTATPNTANLRGLADMTLEEGRLDDFLAIWGKIDDESTKSELAKSLGNALAEEKPGFDVLPLIFPLSDEDRNRVISAMFNSSTRETMALPEVREERRQWIDQLAEQGLAQGARDGIGDLFNEDDRDRVNSEIAAWVNRWPNDDSLKPMVESLMSEWSRFDRQVMIRELAAMPDGIARNRLAAAALNNGLGETEYPEVKALISDAEILKSFEGDPFADPFADPVAK